MRSLEAKGKEMGELEQVYNNLERDWNAYKQSQSRTRTRTCPTCNCTDSGSTVKTLKLLHNSPRHLMSQLQGGDGIRLTGRRLFESMEEEDEMGHVVRSLSFCDSEDEAYNNGYEGSPYYSSSCSSSSSSPFVYGHEKRKVKGLVCMATDEEMKRKIHGGRYIVMLGVFGIALLLFAICMRSATSYGGLEGIALVPT